MPPSEKDEPIGVWYMSFCDTSKPKGSQFLGACFVHARGPVSAMKTAHMRDCNPGGEVLPVPSPSVPAEWMNRLLTREDLTEFDRVMIQTSE